MRRPSERPQLSDCQARCAIVAAEQHGYHREAELHPRSYDARLREDGQAAHDFLAARLPAVVDEALSRPDPIGPETAAIRIVDDGRVSLADAELLIRAAAARGFVAPTIDLPLGPMMAQFETAKAAVAHLWRCDQAALEEVLADRALLAPTPDDAWIPCPSCGR